MNGPKDWSPGKSAQSRDLESWLKGVVLVGGKGEIDIAMKSPVYVAVVHDGSGFNPAAVIVVDQNMYHDLSSEVLEEAFEILKDRDLQDKVHVQELMDEWGDRWEEILTEGYDGRTWTINKPAFAAAAIQGVVTAARLIKILDSAKACEYCGEPEGVRLVRFETSDPPALMCRECREERDDREEGV
jgi:hypothetical protein